MNRTISQWNDFNIDVICQHCRSGKIIPLKIRLTDEDGQLQEYKIKRFKETTHRGEYKMPNGIKVSLNENLRHFTCIIESFRQEKTSR